MQPDILSLPWQVQLTLASGYAAYALAYAGIRAHHQTVEIAFATLVFGTIATATSYGLVWCGVNVFVASAIAFLAAIAAGMFWRKTGRGLLRTAMAKSNISHADDDPSAWNALFAQSKYDVSQIAVKLIDGTWLRCDNTSRFASAPFGPALMGGSGDILIYLTNEDAPDGTSKEIKTTQDNSWGDRVTYIPKEQIARITIRHKARSSRL